MNKKRRERRSHSPPKHESVGIQTEMSFKLRSNSKVYHDFENMSVKEFLETEVKVKDLLSLMTSLSRPEYS